jgi:hypothetical protein
MVVQEMISWPRHCSLRCDIRPRLLLLFDMINSRLINRMAFDPGEQVRAASPAAPTRIDSVPLVTYDNHCHG